MADDKPINLGHLGTVAVGTVDVVLTEKGASAQKENGMSPFWKGVGVVLVGLAIFYFLVPGALSGAVRGISALAAGAPMPNTPSMNLTGGSNTPPAQNQNGGNWEPVDNTAMPIPDGWGPVAQGQSCPAGQHRVATGKKTPLPNGNMRVEEICK